MWTAQRYEPNGHAASLTGLNLSIGLGRAADRLRRPLLIVSRHHRFGRHIFDRPTNRLIDNGNVGTYSDPVKDLDYIRGTHSDTSIACLPAQKCFLRRSMDIDTSLKRASVLGLPSSKPDYSTYDGITTWCVCCQNLASGLPPVKDCSGRRGSTNFGCDLQMTKGSPPTSEIIPFTITRRRYLVAAINLTVYDHGQFLIAHADHDFDLRFRGWRGQRDRRKRRSCGRR